MIFAESSLYLFCREGRKMQKRMIATLIICMFCGSDLVADGRASIVSSTFSPPELEHSFAVQDSHVVADFKQSSRKNGLVVMAAEDYSSYRPGSGAKDGETFTFEDSTAGFIGDGYMRANMAAGDGSTDNAENINIKLSYNIEFVKTGTHYIWAHVFFPSPTGDSFFFGTDGKVVDQVAGSPRGVWNWHKGNASFEIDSAGVHTVDIFGREPNSIIDHIILTTDPAFDPTTDDYTSLGTIAFVSLPGKRDENGVHPDQPFIDDLLAEGYEVNSVYSSSLETASQGLLDTLNAADLVIIGRSGASADFGDPHKTAWNAIKAPVMLLHLYAARNNRLNWLPTATTSAYDTGGETISAKIEAPDDSVFADVTLAADSTMDWVTTPYDYVETTDGGNGTVVARQASTSNVLFVRWQPWVEFYEGAGDMPVGYRTFIGNGNDHANATNGAPFNYYNFTAAAKQVYLNEVARMVGLPVVDPPDSSDQGDLTQIFVAPDGSDTNPGTMQLPLASLQKAQELASPGDTVYVRGGLYQIAESEISEVVSGLFASVTYLNKSGSDSARMNYWAYPGETPVFDFSDVKPQDRRVVGIYVAGQYIHLKGFEMTGIQTTITGHTESYCIYSRGSNNIFEEISMHDNVGTGLRHYGGGGNLFLNCDAYRNHDNVSEDRLGSNNDGFGCHPDPGGTGNVFRGCRAWFNSDDGFDIIRADEAVVFEDCWAFYNGFSTSFQSLGDGNGFKAGGFAHDTADRIPAIIPRHAISFCIAVKNKANGFYSNHHLGGNDWFNNSGYDNSVNFNMVNRESPQIDNIWVNGYDHVLKNNLSYQTRFGIKHTDYIDPSKNTLENNSWAMAISLSNDDFVSLDMALLEAPRQEDGSLPEIDFMRPAPGSAIIDAGVDIGFDYLGSAPELGAIEVDNTTHVDGVDGELPEQIRLFQNYPNPFNPQTAIHYRLARPGYVTVSVYNFQGQRVRTLVQQNQNPGDFTVTWHGKNDFGEPVASGIYFYQLSSSGREETLTLRKKMLLLK